MTLARVKKKKLCAFTLVELLIVIIIIGVLAGAMLLLLGSGTDKAEATKIVSNLRSMKSGAMMYYADNGAGTPPTLTDIEKYMDAKAGAGYGVDTSSFSGRWYASFASSSDLAASHGIAKALDGMDDVGLIGTIASEDVAFVAGDNPVYMRIR